MNGLEWLVSDDPHMMLVTLADAASDRKLRLFCCACVRRIWARLQTSPESQQAVALSETFADGAVGIEELGKARVAADNAISYWKPSERAFSWGEHHAQRAAMWCAWEKIDAIGIARSVVEESAQATRNRKVEYRSQAKLLRDIIGPNLETIPFDAGWRTSATTGLALAIYQDRAFDLLPVLADALMDAGCEQEQILAHCRTRRWHVRGCWVVDQVLHRA